MEMSRKFSTYYHGHYEQQSVILCDPLVINLDSNIIFEMNEIEYYPKYTETNELVSDDRFKITMNDGNTIIVNTNTVDVINKYNEIYASLGDRKGTINLDSNKLSNLVFIPYEE